MLNQRFWHVELQGGHQQMLGGNMVPHAVTARSPGKVFRYQLVAYCSKTGRAWYEATGAVAGPVSLIAWEV